MHHCRLYCTVVHVHRLGRYADPSGACVYRYGPVTKSKLSYGAESSPDCLSQDPARQHRAEIDRDQGTPPARAGNLETDLKTCSIIEVTRESEERFVTDQATYTLVGPPELRWGNLKGVSASRESEYSVHLSLEC